ncbi:MAG: hypothetical protein U5L02_19415 [Rheinheimera sp.]|nr:hypothetical protein [Rheinheimera sp.]
MAIPTPFNTTACEILLQEIPGEVSLAYLISGCSLGCKGCHKATVGLHGMDSR